MTEKSTNEEKELGKVKLVNVRLSYPSLFTPQKDDKGALSFNATFLIQKSDPQIKVIEAAMREVAKEKWGAKWEGVYLQLDKADKLALHDGDTKPDSQGYEDQMFINSRRKTKPKVLDRDKSELTEQDGRPYSGCYVHAIIKLWAQDNDYGKRINAELKGVQFYKDGDAFAGGGGTASADEFDDLGVDEDDDMEALA